MAPDHPPTLTIAFCGLGAMGGGMATNLVKHGFSVTGYDVYQPLVEKFQQAGGHAAATPREAAEHADLVISMVANAAQNAALLFDGPDAVVQGLQKGKTFMLCSTTAPSFVGEIRKRFDEEFGRADVRVLDCPVSGGTLRAAGGTLSIFAAGADEDLDAVWDVLACMAENLYRRDRLGDGQKTKAVHQLLAATNIISASEAMGLAATAGLDTKVVVDHVNASNAASFMFTNRAPHMLTNDWSALSALGIILKDTGIVATVAREVQCPTPLANAAHEMYLQGVQAGLLRDDDAKLVQLYLPPTQGDLVSKLAGSPDSSTSPKGPATMITKETIVDLLEGIHLAASMECMALCQALGQDRATMCEIVSKAAGWNAMFTRVVPAMVEADRWSLADVGGEEVARVRDRLAAAVEKCIALRFPCPMAAAALQCFHFAAVKEMAVVG